MPLFHFCFVTSFIIIHNNADAPDHLDLFNANDVHLKEHEDPPPDQIEHDVIPKEADSLLNVKDDQPQNDGKQMIEDESLQDKRQPIDLDPKSKSQPIKHQLERPLFKKAIKKPFAWVSMIDSNINSVIGARVLSQSLSKYGSKADKILICVPGASDASLNMLRQFGWETRTVDVNTFEKITHYPHHIQHELFKILLFNLTEYGSVGYLSPQSMVTTNIDHLFECGESALCGTPDDRHHEMYHHHQQSIRSMLSDENVDYILYDGNGRMKRGGSSSRDGALQFGAHEAVFDDNIFVVAPEHEIYRDLFQFITSSHDEMEGLEHDASTTDFPSYLSEYFYHYCKGSGHPISRQHGLYTPPRVTFQCSSSSKSSSNGIVEGDGGDDNGHFNGMDIECKMEKEISKSACYVLENGYNFHPSHNDHISASWHWQNPLKHLSIKIIQYSSYSVTVGTATDHNMYKPWKWRMAAFSGWMMEWNEFAEQEPNLYFDFLLFGDEDNEELIYMLWQTPLLYLLFMVILLSSCTAVSSPCFALCALLIDSFTTSWPTLMRSLLMIHRVAICPVVALWTLYLIAHPIEQVFVSLEVIPESYPLTEGCLLSLQYCYLTTCSRFVTMCFVLYWIGTLYHPKRCRLQWPRFLQHSLFAFDPNLSRNFLFRSSSNLNLYQPLNASFSPSRGPSSASSKRRRYSQRRDDKGSSFEDLILRLQQWRLHCLYDVALRYCSVLVLIAVQWCLLYMVWILLMLSTIWILRWNDWNELKLIITAECVVALISLIYCSLGTCCQFFIYPQIRKYGERYYDTGSFAKGQ